MCRLRQENEVAHDPKKHGVIVLYSSLDSGHPLVQRRLCGSKRTDSIHNSSKLPITDMNMLRRLMCCVGRAGSVGTARAQGRGPGLGHWTANGKGGSGGEEMNEDEWSPPPLPSPFL